MGLFLQEKIKMWNFSFSRFIPIMQIRHSLSTFHILIFSSETTGPIATKPWWNGPWMAPFQNCVQSLKIEKRGEEILIVHCCFSISENELKF